MHKVLSTMPGVNASYHCHPHDINDRLFFFYFSVFCILNAVQYLLIVEEIESEKNKSMSNNML